MDIRLVTVEDLSALAGMHARAFTEADSQKPWTADRSLKLLEHFYHIQPDLFFVAEKEGVLTGAMMAMIKPWRRGNRCTEAILFVHPEHQNSGIGKKLFRQTLKEVIHKYQADSFEAVTFANNEFPLTWYKKIGLMPDEHAVLITGKTEEMLRRLEP